MNTKPSANELYHHGVLGQKWGIRRYQNKNGSLTKEGKDRQKKELKAYKEKEIGRLNKQKEKVSTKIKKNQNPSADDFGVKEIDLKKIKKLQAKKKQIDREIKLVKDYKFKDMSAEKIALGKKTAIKTVAAMSFFVVPLAPDVAGVALLASVANDKTKYRSKLIAEQDKRKRVAQ